MEHRLSKRVEGELPILVYKRGVPVATGMVRDISRRGLFISTDYSDVRLNQTIELAFRFPEWSSRGHCMLSAHVVRSGDGGLGLDFEGVDNDGLTITALIVCLQQQASSNFLTGRYREHRGC